jgi:hypothetical protein
MRRKFIVSTFSLTAAIVLTLLNVNIGHSDSEYNSNSHEISRIKIVNSDKSQSSCPYQKNNSCEYLQKARQSKCPAFKSKPALIKHNPNLITI